MFYQVRLLPITTRMNFKILTSYKFNVLLDIIAA